MFGVVDLGYDYRFWGVEEGKFFGLRKLCFFSSFMFFIHLVDLVGFLVFVIFGFGSSPCRYVSRNFLVFCGGRYRR